MPRSRSKPPATSRSFFSASGSRRDDAREIVLIAEPSPAAVRRRFAEELENAKLDAMKELAYGASHEINNPLANIALRAQTLLKRETDAEKRKLLEAMHRSAMRAHEMISDLMLFARPPALEMRAVRLRELLDVAVAESLRPAADRGVEIACRPVDPGVVAWADPVQLAVAIKALVDNAIEAISSDGADATGEVALSATGARDGRVVVEVRDDGPGIPASIRPHVFDPFFSGREAGRGLGFGLSKCWRIVTDHGGDVTIDSGSPRGVVATLRLPAAPGASDC